MLVPIYVIHWNAPARCAESVRSLLGSEGVEVALTVIDNASSALPDLPAGARMDRLDRNIGFAAAANRGLRLAGAAPFVVITSHDVEVEPDALSVSLDFAAAHPEYGVLGLEGGGANDGSDGWLSGSFLLLRRECVSDVGQFDELFGSYCEDVDYCHRALAKGWKIGLAPGARATTVGTAHPERAKVLMDANFTALAAKEGDWPRVARKLGGMVRRRWFRSFALACRQLTRLQVRTLRSRF